LASKRVYLSLGSNLGDRNAHLTTALDKLEQQQIRVTARSSLYETEPHDVSEQPWFLNMAVACETSYFPIQLLKVLQGIERDMGRTRGPNTVRRGPRPIDLDILLVGSAVVNTPILTIPHPRMLDRRFVLEPLIEIAPDLKFPGTMKPLKSFIPAVSSQRVRKLH
jgi:2-amino-4-hydroxy-6-hydroxymethyldihydropteridine diphosphokinase